MTAFLILYTAISIVFATGALWWLRDPNHAEPWVKSIAWSVLIGAFWPIALGGMLYALINTRWI